MSKQMIESSAVGAIDQAGSAETTSKLEERCRNCKPLSIVECINGCRVWRMKNEFRELQKKMQNAEFAKALLNAIKNKRRLQILRILSETQLTFEQLQSKLKVSRYAHSLKTITNEYISPLLEGGLVDETRGKLHLTLLGAKLNEQIRGSVDIAEVLPAHSECHEEKVLGFLLEGPATFESLSEVIPPRSLGRVLRRLQASKLLDPPATNHYVFFFRTQRDPEKEVLSSTERKIYWTIPEKGISAKELSKNSDVSIRKTYKYLRRLKGKKLVFVRRKPRNYALTTKGQLVAVKLSSVYRLLEEFRMRGEKLANNDSDKVTARTPLLRKAELHIK